MASAGLGYGQVRLQPSDMQRDLDHLKKYLRKWHPAYDDYTPRAAWDSIFGAAKKDTETPLLPREFTNVVRRVVAHVGCGHMYVYAKTRNDSLRLLPLTLWADSGKFYVRSYKAPDTARYIGSEIISINGHPIDSVANAVREIVFSDGRNETHKYSTLEKDIDINYYRLFGAADHFRVAVQTMAGERDTLTLRPTLTKDLPKLPIAGYRQVRLVKQFDGLQLYEPAFDSLTRILDIDNFDGKKQRRAFRQAFRHLRHEQVQHLVLDLRDNGGGSIFKGNYFLTHLLPQAIVPFVITRKPNLHIINPRFKASFWERITPVLFTANPIQFPSRHGWNHAFLFKKRTRNHFHGSVYVLTNGGTFSMASLVASYLKHKRQAVIIGEETGGSEYASRSSASGIIVLPASRLHVEFNVYQTIHQLRLKDTGRGVMPHHPVSYTITDRVGFRDKDLEKAQELIRSTRNPAASPARTE